MNLKEIKFYNRIKANGYCYKWVDYDLGDDIYTIKLYEYKFTKYFAIYKNYLLLDYKELEREYIFEKGEEFKNGIGN